MGVYNGVSAMGALDGKVIGLLVASGFDEMELTVARQAFEEEGAETRVVSPKKHEVRGWRNTDWGASFAVDVAVIDANPKDFDGLMVPGGLISADTLRSDPHAVALVREALKQNVPVAALGHAPWLLIEAGAVRGRAVTSMNALKTDLQNAGALWRDEPIVADRGIVTGRHHHDLPDFVAGMLESIVL